MEKLSIFFKNEFVCQLTYLAYIFLAETELCFWFFIGCRLALFRLTATISCPFPFPRLISFNKSKNLSKSNDGCPEDLPNRLEMPRNFENCRHSSEIGRKQRKYFTWGVARYGTQSVGGGAQGPPRKWPRPQTQRKDNREEERISSEREAILVVGEGSKRQHQKRRERGSHFYCCCWVVLWIEGDRVRPRFFFFSFLFVGKGDWIVTEQSVSWRKIDY